MRVVLNGEVLYETREYRGLYRESEANISLLNEIGMFGSHPLHGAVTDLNIWSSALAAGQLSDWTHCRHQQGGDVIDWETAGLVITGLQTFQLDKEEVCLAKQHGKVYRAFNISLTFPETVKFCRNLGGEVGVADSEDNLSKMVVVFSETCPAHTRLYTGHTDGDTEGDWRDVNTGEWKYL